jgi:hypothetical protein
VQVPTYHAQKITRSDKLGKPTRYGKKEKRRVPGVCERAVFTRRTLAKRVRPPRHSLIRPMRNWGGDVGDERRTAAMPPAAASSAEPVKKYFLKGGARLLDKGTRLVTRPSHLGTRVRALLAKAKGRAKRRAETSSKAKAGTKAKLKLKVKQKLN